MKNLFLLLIFLLNFSLITQLTAQVTTTSQPTPTKIDTITIFDAITFEKVDKIVVPMEENIAGEKYEIDTIITFDAKTFEETMEIVKTKIVARTPQSFNQTDVVTLTEAEMGLSLIHI